MVTMRCLLAEFVATIDRRERRRIDFLVDLNQRLAHDIKYIIRMEPGVQTPAETLARGRGSCRDSGWLLVEVLRNLGFAARFVSGYLIHLPPHRKTTQGAAGPAAGLQQTPTWG